MMFDASQHDLGPIQKKRHSFSWQAAIFLSCLRSSWSKDPQQGRLLHHKASIALGGEETIAGQDIILVACDTVYFWDYAVSFLRSLSAIGTPFHVHLHLIRPNRDVVDALETLRRELVTVRISYGIDTLTGLDLPKRLNIYYNCARFIVADQLLERGARRLLILDVDTVARSCPWEKLEAVQTEGAFSFRPKARKPWHKILAGTVFFQNTPRVRRFARQFAASLIDVLARNPVYHIDQIIPHYLLTIGGFQWKQLFGSVPDDLMSLSYAPNASLWMAKGREKYETVFQNQIKTIHESHKSSAVGLLEEVD